MADKTLIVAGAGTLGCRVAELWRGLHPEAKIYLKTKTNKEERSRRWNSLKFESFSNETPLNIKSPYVVFCAPPSDGYGDAAKATVIQHWDESAESSCFVFTSSGGVYSVNQGETVNEQSDVKDTDYIKSILEAEKNTLEASGSVIRLGGLYTLKRGAHNFWLTSGKSPFGSSMNGLINLIHYDDAADAVVQLLLKGLKRQLFLLSDGQPISRGDICRSALKNPKFSSFSMPEFKESNVDGKVYDSSQFRNSLGWKPQMGSFDAFMTDLYRKERCWNLLD